MAKHTAPKSTVSNNQIQEQLSALLRTKPTTGKQKPSQNRGKKSYANRDVDVQSWKADGEDHINIWQAAQTVLGRFLSHDTAHRYNHSHLGQFQSIRGLWYYIQSHNHDDRYRRLSNQPLKKLQLDNQGKKVINFRAILMDACWQRLKQSPSIMELMKESTLPFDCYYLERDTGLRVRPSFHSWITSGTEEMRKAIKEGREPSFKFLMENKKIGLYDPITPEYLKEKKAEEVAVDVVITAPEEAETDSE